MKKIFFILFLFYTTLAFAQNVEFTKENFMEDKDALSIARKDIETGDVFYIRGPKYYKQAINPYVAANQFNPNNALLNFKLGKCYLYSSFKLKSIPNIYTCDSILGPINHVNLFSTGVCGCCLYII